MAVVVRRCSYSTVFVLAVHAGGFGIFSGIEFGGARKKTYFVSSRRKTGGLPVVRYPGQGWQFIREIIFDIITLG